MGRGGKRNGVQGRAYSNRTDLSGVKPPPVTAAPGQPYGVAGAQIAAQQAVPVAPPPTTVTPQDLPPLSRPTDRPNEPVTAGMPIGPGPGPEVLPPLGNDNLNFLRGIYTQFPDEQVRDLIEALEAGEF